MDSNSRHRQFILKTVEENKLVLNRILETYLDNGSTELNKTRNVSMGFCNMEAYLKLNERICNGIITGKYSRWSSHDTTGNQELLELVASINDKEDKVKLEKYWFKDSNVECDIDSIKDNCSAIRQSYLYGKNVISEKERMFPLAFALKVHTNINQAHRLLRYIYRPHNVYCVHIDKKAPSELYSTFRSIADCLENVIVIGDRVRIIYSTITHVYAEMKCMRALLKSRVRWKYYINLTGQEFMLKTNLEMIEILELLNGTNEVESYPIGLDRDRIDTKILLGRNIAIRTPERKEPFSRNVTIKKGSAYGLYSRQFVRFVVRDKLAKELIAWLNDTYAPEETIWATLNALPKVPGSFQGDLALQDGTFISRAVKWRKTSDENCHGRFVRNVCIYGLGDLPWLLRHENIVANKFYESYQPEALNCLENIMYQVLMSREGSQPNFNISFYKTLPHFKPRHEG